MEQKEVKIGEVTQIGRVKLKCAKSKSGCSGCFFLEADSEKVCVKLLNICGLQCCVRKDNNHVIFIKVEE